MNAGPRAALLGATALALAPQVRACPCQGSAGPASSVTMPGERFGASLTETARIAQGTFSPAGTYRAFMGDSHESTLDVTALGGYRPLPRVEVSVETAVGHSIVTGPDFATRHTGFGDTTARVRWDATDEPVPFEPHAVPWPAVSGVLSVRMPTASGAASGSSGTTGSIGSSASSEGLGAWEAAAGVVLLRSVGARWQATFFGEAAYRFPDTSIGIERHRPPRLFGQIGARYAPTPTTGVGVLTDLGWEGNVSIDGTAERATSQRLWTVSLFGTFRTSPNGLRWGALLRWVPPVSGFNRNATGTTSVGVSLGYAF